MTTITLDDAPLLQIDGLLATITLRRPRVANRLNVEDVGTLQAHVEQVNRSDALVLRIASTGKYFCSGYDIGQLKGGLDSGFERLVNALEDCRPVTIAVLQGGVYGGATDLALACDFRVGTSQVNMFMPAARLGLHFYGRGMKRYVSRLGLNMAKRLFLTADRLDANEMLACGFLTSLVAVDQLQSEIDRLSQRLSEMAPLALIGMKKHLNRIARQELNVIDLLADMAQADESLDLAQGRLAWQEKRKPVFKGH